MARWKCWKVDEGIMDREDLAEYVGDVFGSKDSMSLSVVSAIDVCVLLIVITLASPIVPLNRELFRNVASRGEDQLESRKDWQNSRNAMSRRGFVPPVGTVLFN